MRFHRSGLAPWLSLAAVTVLLLIPIPGAQRWPALTEALLNFCHPLAFAWLAHAGYVALRAVFPLPSPAPYLLVLAGAAGYGALIEAVQSFTGRQASLLDFVNDVLGAGFALLLHARAGRAGRDRRTLAIAACACAAAAITPLLLTLAAYAHRSLSAPVLWRDGTPAFMQFAVWQRGGAPGLFVHETLPDWRRWKQLEIDIGNPLPEDLQVVVRINDRFHDYKGPDRWARPYQLPPQSRTTLRIPLDEIRSKAIEREIELGAMRGLMILGGPRDQLPPFKVYGIRLTPGS